MNKEQIELNKTFGQNQKDASVKGCLRGGDEQTGCSGKIVQAHSIQRGKILASIADGSSGKVYYLGLALGDDTASMIPEFKLEGIKKFSTFSGFCGRHDKIIFQPIEDMAFTATAKQKDIYAYRAAAKELHANLRSKRLCEVQLGDKLDVDGAATEFGNNRTLGVCHVARRSFECPSSQSDFSKPAARLTFH